MDRYGRVVAVVKADDMDVSWSLLAEGHAWWYKKYAPKDSLYEGAENMARYEGKGIWRNAGEAVEPWVFRSKK